MTEDLRQAIRSILLEELANQGVNLPAIVPAAVRVEEVRIASDRDLATFVRRVLALGRNEATRSDIESGRHVFRLQAGDAGVHSSAQASLPRNGGTITIDKGLITEKKVRGFADGISVIKVGSGVRLTPLASDAIRRAGIKIEKVKS